MPRLNTHSCTKTPSHRIAWATLLLVAATAMSGCLEGGSKPQGTAAATASVPAGSSTTTSPADNQAPEISGAPIAALNFSTIYDFVPTSSDADDDMLAFSIANKPSWAAFSTSTGRLSGTPGMGNLGTYANVIISVSDGSSSVSLTPFSINVTQVSNGSAVLSWLPPTENVDGSQLTNLSGYRIYYGTSASTLTQTIEVPQAGIASYLVDNLSPATWYFAIKAVAGNVESDFSEIRSKAIS